MNDYKLPYVVKSTQSSALKVKPTQSPALKTLPLVTPSLFSHRCWKPVDSGNPIYDADIHIVRSFVRLFQDPNNHHHMSAVTSYYLSGLLLYWDEFVDYLQSGHLLSDTYTDKSEFDLGSNWSHICLDTELSQLDPRLESPVVKDIFLRLANHAWPISLEEIDLVSQALGFEPQYIDPQQAAYYLLNRYILSRLAEYEIIFRTKYEAIRRTIEDYGTNEMAAILGLYLFIANLSCLYPYPTACAIDIVHSIRIAGTTPEWINLDDRILPRVHFLVNRTGYFGFNTYLYAFFEGVFISGIPSIMGWFDLRVACASVFLAHDLGHIASILKLSDYPRSTNSSDPVFSRGAQWQLNRDVYYLILNDNFDDVRGEMLSSVTANWIVKNTTAPASDAVHQRIPQSEVLARRRLMILYMWWLIHELEVYPITSLSQSNWLDMYTFLIGSDLDNVAPMFLEFQCLLKDSVNSYLDVHNFQLDDLSIPILKKRDRQLLDNLNAYRQSGNLKHIRDYECVILGAAYAHHRIQTNYRPRLYEAGYR